ncbi:MAG: hypothetical protein PW788_14055 [Micavibrio sp.]|nr:hypothetical protein [Micavibrio sp.]
MKGTGMNKAAVFDNSLTRRNHRVTNAPMISMTVYAAFMAFFSIAWAAQLWWR